MSIIKIRKKKKDGVKTTESLLASLDGIPSSNKDKRGMDAEMKAYLAAKHWKNKKIIKDVSITQRLGTDDMDMKDLVITLLSGEQAFIQVKNYCNFLVFQKCRQKGINLFFIWPDEGEDIAIERMRNLIISVYLSNVGHLSIRRIIKELIKEGEDQKENPRNGFIKKFFAFLPK